MIEKMNRTLRICLSSPSPLYVIMAITRAQTSMEGAFETEVQGKQHDGGAW